MRATRLGRVALAAFFVAGWVACSGIAVDPAQAQFVNPPPPPPPPVFNPSVPNTAPQAPETPVSPGTPSALPGSGSNVVLPPDENLPDIATRSHRHAVTPETSPSGAATALNGRHGARHHRLGRSRQSYTAVAGGPVETPYYVSPFGWGFNSPVRSCVWEQHWDGYWAPFCM
jgi:hypothetical protein